MDMFFPILMLVIMFGIMYLLLIRPQKKRDKETAQMRNSVQVGDEIITIGGIVGRVVVIKEDHLIIETGSDRSKIRVKRWAIQSNETAAGETTQEPTESPIEKS